MNEFKKKTKDLSDKCAHLGADIEIAVREELKKHGGRMRLTTEDEWLAEPLASEVSPAWDTVIPEEIYIDDEMDGSIMVRFTEYDEGYVFDKDKDLSQDEEEFFLTFDITAMLDIAEQMSVISEIQKDRSSDKKEAGKEDLHDGAEHAKQDMG